MNTSKHYHGPVLEGLCAFVRENMTVKTASEKRSSPSSVRTSKAQSWTSSSWWRDQSIEVRDAINAEDDSFSIDPKEVRLILRAASTIRGWRSVKSYPFMVRSRTRLFSRRTSSRKPSYLSWNQSGPEGRWSIRLEGSTQTCPKIGIPTGFASAKSGPEHGPIV